MVTRLEQARAALQNAERKLGVQETILSRNVSPLPHPVHPEYVESSFSYPPNREFARQGTAVPQLALVDDLLEESWVCPPSMQGLFPSGILPGMSLYVGSRLLSLILAGVISSQGGWVAFLGIEDMSWEAAQNLGLCLERSIRITFSPTATPHTRLMQVVASSIDGFDAVVLGPLVSADRHEYSVLQRRALKRKTLLISETTPGKKTLNLTSLRVRGMNMGSGCIRILELDVQGNTGAVAHLSVAEQGLEKMKQKENLGTTGFPNAYGSYLMSLQVPSHGVFTDESLLSSSSERSSSMSVVPDSSLYASFAPPSGSTEKISSLLSPESSNILASLSSPSLLNSSSLSQFSSLSFDNEIPINDLDTANEDVSARSQCQRRTQDIATEALKENSPISLQAYEQPLFSLEEVR